MGAWNKEPESLIPTVEPTERDILFFAGFYEGEGSACAGKNGSCIVQVPQKDPEVLYRARSLWGGSIRPNGRGIYVWVMSGDRGRLFLQTIYPFLSGRRKEQIERSGGLVFSGKTPLAVSGITPERAMARAAMTEKQRHSETCGIWAKNNPEKAREISQRFRDKNRELVNARQRERRTKLRAMKSCTSHSDVSERSQLVN